MGARWHFRLYSNLSAQRVNDAVFCRSIDNLACINPIANGQSISIEDLPLKDGYRKLYYWGSLTNPGERSVAFYFLREGECYPREKLDVNASALENISISREAANWLANKSIGDVLSWMGVWELTIGKGDIKANFVLASGQSKNYRVHDWRNVLCPGTFSARLLDSNGNPIPGNNDLRVIVTN